MSWRGNAPSWRGLSSSSRPIHKNRFRKETWIEVEGGQFSGTGKCKRGIPSPLNGEKVAAGRMRGGNTCGSGSIDSFSQHQLTSSPLTPALSPLRGEGERPAALANDDHHGRSLGIVSAKWPSAKPLCRDL